MALDQTRLQGASGMRIAQPQEPSLRGPNSNESVSARAPASGARRSFADGAQKMAPSPPVAARRLSARTRPRRVRISQTCGVGLA